MRVFFASAFLRSLKKLDPQTRESVKDAVGKVLDLYGAGTKPGGLGIKHLRGELWEARAGLRLRVVYVLGQGAVRFVLAGSHDDVKDFLKD